MNIDILITNNEVAPFVNQIITLADQHKKALGFLPQSTFKEQCLKERLWVAIDKEYDLVVGFLMFSSNKTQFKIIQLFTQRKFRKSGIGLTLINKLSEYGESLGTLNIRARVAADLSANQFWEKAGFKIVNQVKGGKSTGRTINIRIRDLNTPSLLMAMGLHTSITTSLELANHNLKNSPIYETPIYAVDLNIFYDIIRKRLYQDSSANIIKSCLGIGKFKLFVTPEFKVELLRTTRDPKNDPMLNFLETLPLLSEVDNNQLDNLKNELKTIVFPDRKLNSKKAANDNSDLLHLSYVIAHKLSGFITREQKIINSSKTLKEKYDISIISPSDLNVNYMELAHKSFDHDVCDFHIKYNVDLDKATLANFFDKFSIDTQFINKIWKSFEPSNKIRRIVVESDYKLAAIGVWDLPDNITNNITAFIYVDEEADNSIKSIDHIVEKMFQDCTSKTNILIDLWVHQTQEETISSLMKRGFLKTNNISEYGMKFVKIIPHSIITSDNWEESVKVALKYVALDFNKKIPSLDEFINTGIYVTEKNNNTSTYLKLFKFETFFSPAKVLIPGRNAMIIPIDAKYSNQLLDLEEQQPDLPYFPKKHAILHSERAYFRKPSALKKYSKGKIIFFYESEGKKGKGSKAIIGWARMTSSKKINVNIAKEKYFRHGVFENADFNQYQNKEGDIHVFTFDNFTPFPRQISYQELKEMQCVSPANLVTAEEINYNKVVRIIKKAFSLEDKK